MTICIRRLKIDYPLISPERPDEFDNVDPELVELIRHLRREKVELHDIERKRVKIDAESSGTARSKMLDKMDERIAELYASRRKLLHEVAKMTPCYPAALRYAVNKYGFNEAIGTARYNKRRGGCYTFGMPGMPVMAVWVDAGAVVKAEPID
jgi:hypothetical protein